MKIVIAISHVDLQLAALLATRLKQISQTGALMPSSCLVVSTWADSWDTRPVFDYLAKFMPSDFLITTDPEDDQWPEACTHLFYESARWLHEHDNKEPWFFFEPDCAPLRPDWWAALTQEYAEAEAAGKHYMGVRNTAIILNKKTGELYDDMEHMVGAGIYPADFWTRSKAVHSCGHWPWDCAIGEEVLPELHDTKLIAHRWNTHSWVRDADGFLVGQLTEKAISMKAKPPRLVGPDAAVLHGCKDASIFKVALFEKAS
jgi:hypothetical protein